jgi:hypothetical protein
MLPALVAAVNAGRTSATKRLVAARATEPGALFTAGGFTLRRSTAIRAQVVNIWAEDPTSGARRNLTPGLRTSVTKFMGCPEGP